MTKFLRLITLTMFAVGLPLAGHAQIHDVAGGEVRAPSPRIMDPNRPGYFELGIGPGFGMGLDTDRVMYDINASYNRNFSDRLTGKIIGDFNLGSSSDSARFIDLGVGVDAYLQEVQMSYGIPYLSADLGYGFVRNNNDRTQDAPAVGVGTGFRFAAEAINFDVNLHYEFLTAQLDSTTPSILGIRAAMNF